MPSNEYMRLYMQKRRANRIAEGKVILGGCCVCCGATDSLEFDHIDPKTKTDTIANLVDSKRWREELKKCQLLCTTCHQKKTLVDLGRVSARETHGTLSSYRYCKCDLCRSARREYIRGRKKQGKN